MLKLSLVAALGLSVAIATSAPSLATQCSEFEDLLFVDFDVVQSGGSATDEAIREFFSDTLGCGYWDMEPEMAGYIECGPTDSGDIGIMIEASR